MSSDILNHLWQSTAFAILAGLLTLAFRKNRAQVRYWLWFSASVKFLIPFLLLLTLGGYMGRSRAAKSIPIPAVTYAVVQVAEPFPIAPPPSSPAQTYTDWIPIVLLSLWACGFGGIVLIRLRGWQRIRSALRASTPMDLPFPVPVRSSTVLMEPGVVGFFGPVLLLPAGIVERLVPSELEAILAHESCHVRRRDNLTAAIHMIVEAAFWFHPLVWWISARLMDERERACDEGVLELGSEPQVYADSILKTCAFCVESPLDCVSGVTGADLKKRIARIMTERVVGKLSLGRKLLLAAVGIAVIAGPVVFGLIYAQRIRSHARQTNLGPLPSFGVASVKLNLSGDSRALESSPPGRFTARNATLRSLIESAYNVRDYQLSRGPLWVDFQGFDIDAKVGNSGIEEVKKLTDDQQREQLRLRLQSLLTDRFRLRLSHEFKNFTGYALVVAENGPKVQPAKSGDAYSDGIIRRDGLPAGPHTAVGKSGQLIIQALPMASVARLLSLQLGCDTDTILDKTGLTGDYDLTLQWTPDESQTQPCERQGINNAPPPRSLPPSMLTAIVEQLGLKLESREVPTEFLVINSVKRPSAN